MKTPTSRPVQSVTANSHFREFNMNYEQIIYDVDDNILTITLNRPEKLNAFTHQMMTEIVDALDRADADDNVKAIIFTGAGRGFCAGADLSGGARTFDHSDSSRQAEADGGGLLTLRIFDCLKPVIAACNGPSVGVGTTMQCAMDIRMASDSARFGFVFAKRGLVPEAASSWFCRASSASTRHSSGAIRQGCSTPPKRWRSDLSAASKTRRPVARCTRSGARVLRPDIGRVRRHDSPDAMENADGRASGGCAQHRFAGNLPSGSIRRCARGRSVLFGKTRGAISGQGQRRYAAFLSVVEAA